MWKRIKIVGMLILAGHCWIAANDLYASTNDMPVKVSADYISQIYESVDVLELLQENKHDELIQFADSILLLANNNKLTFWEGRANYLKAYVSEDRGESVNALRWYLTAKDDFVRASDFEWAGKSSNSIGALFYSLKDYEKALNYFLESIAYRPADSDQNSLARVKSNIGKIYLEQGDYELSKLYLNEALKITQSDVTKQNILIELGRISSTAGDQQMAIQYYEDAIALGYNYRSRRAYAHAYTNLGSIFFERGEYSRAEDLLNVSVDLLGQYDLNDQKLTSYYFLASIEKQRKDLSAATQFYDAGLQYFNFEEPELTESCFDEYLQILFDKADWPKYAEVNKRYNNYLKQRAEKANDYALLEQRYNFRQIEQEYLDQRAQAQVSTPNYFMNILWGVGLLGILLTLGYYMHQAQQRKDQLNKMKKNAAAAYMDAYEFLYGDDPEA